MIKNRDIIIVGQQPWDTEIGSNCKNIAIEFSKNNRVLYVNSPLDRITAMLHPRDAKIIKRLNVINRKEPSLIKIGENLWNLYPTCIVESINWIPQFRLFNQINKINCSRFASSINKAIQTLAFTNYFLFNDNEIIKCFYLPELLTPVKTIYYSRDYILATTYWKKHGVKLEPLMIAKSDVCVANSAYLASYCKNYNPQTYDIGQGCDQELTCQNRGTLPPVLNNLPGKYIGYVGALTSTRLDIDLLLFLSQQRPEWFFILVGPEDSHFKKSLLHKQSNVFFTGQKSAEELPAFINSFNVCINPQLHNELTVGNYPRKVDEYLLQGKPVVATATISMEMFREYVYLADNKEHTLQLIETALQEEGETAAINRKKFASTHTWKNSVAAIYDAIESAG